VWDQIPHTESRNLEWPAAGRGEQNNGPPMKTEKEGLGKREISVKGRELSAEREKREEAHTAVGGVMSHWPRSQKLQCHGYRKSRMPEGRGDQSPKQVSKEKLLYN